MQKASKNSNKAKRNQIGHTTPKCKLFLSDNVYFQPKVVSLEPK